MTAYDLQVHFDKTYVAEPYWPSMARLIDIQKQSGINRCRTQKTRDAALKGHLDSLGMTLADYEALERDARRPFYTDETGQIIMPPEQIHAFLANVCAVISSQQRPCGAAQVRVLVDVTPWTTGKTEADGVWERFATVKSGSGQTLSNQRGLRRSSYIADFDATGRVSFDPELIKAKTLRAAIEWGGLHIGIGSSRKMGHGRFRVTGFAEAKPGRRKAA